mmetsp:Transcript_66315/g.76951  ORF Transcript_66315/g.76951 Transcript_66315/m.76951 type:complete len:224 (-) Transcript_66315:171-842(-)
MNAESKVQKMIEIIQNEANDKALKIRETALGQFNIEKNKILNQQRDKIIQDYSNKLEQYAMQKRIERSGEINKIRVNKMNARHEVLSKIKDDVAEQLKTKLKKRETYKSLMKKLIIQGLIKLMEKEVTIKGTQADLDLLQEVAKDAADEFCALIKKETGVEFKTTITVDSKSFLTEVHTKLGGVVLSAHKGKIVCANTLDNRLELVYNESIPDLRKNLFPELK